MRRSAGGWGAGLWLLGLIVASPAAALELSADAADRGWIGFSASGRAGTTVTVVEKVGAEYRPVTSFALGATGTGARPRAARWRCDRRDREFVASAPGPFGTTEYAAATARTGSCRRRLKAAVSRRRTRAGKRIAVRLRDRFGVGEVRVRLCVRPPAARTSCRGVPLAPGQARRVARFRAVRPGRWAVSAQVQGGKRMKQSVRVRPRRGRLRILATGDSMIQIIDSFLKQRLGSVRSDARISTGISKPSMFNWMRHSRRQARGGSDVTVVFIGANDGFPIGDAQCCGEQWVEGYSRRVRSMMAAYRRGRKGVVYWLTLPAPRDADFARVFGPVNRAIVRAARTFRGNQVRVLDLRKTFTPGGRFTRVIRYRGKTVVARQDDGVHLSRAGASIAAELIIRAMKRDRVR